MTGLADIVLQAETANVTLLLAAVSNIESLSTEFVTGASDAFVQSGTLGAKSADTMAGFADFVIKAHSSKTAVLQTHTKGVAKFVVCALRMARASVPAPFISVGVDTHVKSISAEAKA